MVQPFSYDEVLYTASAAAEYRVAGITGDYLDIEGVSISTDGRTLYAYAVNYGALVVFAGLSSQGVGQVRLILPPERALEPPGGCNRGCRFLVCPGCVL